MSAQLEVRGGSGGTAAQLEELDAAVTTLLRSAAALDDAAGALHVGRSLVDGLRAAPDGAGAALALDADVVTALADLVGAAGMTRELAAGVASATAAYRTVEEGNEALWFVGRLGAAVALAPLGRVLREELVPALPVASLVVPALVSGGDAGGDAGGDDREDGQPEPPGPPVVECAPGGPAWSPPATGDPRRAPFPGEAVRESIAGASGEDSWCVQPSSAEPGAGLPRFRVHLPDGSPQLLAALLGTAVAGGASLGARSASPAAARRMLAQWQAGGVADATRASVTPVPVAASTAAQGPPRSVADLLQRTGATADATTGPSGRVRVERVIGAGGGSAAVVYLPGVQRWPLDSRNPVSGASAVRAEAGLPSAYTDLVVQALDEAGVERGEPVMLVGHSLGGLVAVQAAADPAVRERFDVTAVVTAGSPIGAAVVPRDVAVLALEHPDDPVPGFDGVDNADLANLTTVIGATPAGTGPHDLDGYVLLGAQADASDLPSVLAWREAAAPFLDAPTAVSEVTEAQGTAIDPTPHPALG